MNRRSFFARLLGATMLPEVALPEVSIVQRVEAPHVVVHVEIDHRKVAEAMIKQLPKMGVQRF